MTRRHSRSRDASRGRPGRRWWAITAVVAGALVILGGAGALLSRPAPPAVSGPPRLAVDRLEIDLGRQPFERHVSASFVVTNAGGDTLRLDHAPPVEVIQGC